VIEGAKKAIDTGFKLRPPKCVQDAIESYREGNDWLKHFIEECCMVGSEFEQKSGELYQEYRLFCQRNGEYARSTTDFYKEMENAGYERRKKNSGRFVLGLKLKSDFFE
jgi:phage/plasmid-associated DNA primase